MQTKQPVCFSFKEQALLFHEGLQFIFLPDRKKKKSVFIIFFCELIIFYLGGKLTLSLINSDLSKTCLQKHSSLSQLSMLSILVFYDFMVVV